jgi:hypothetical protein
MTIAVAIARALAIIIAALAVVDPTMRTTRSAKPDVAIVTRSDRDSTLANRLSNQLGKQYTIVNGAWDAAAATIIVGNALPERIPVGTVFAIRDTLAASIDHLDLPSSVTAESRVPINVGSRNGTVELRSNNAVLDRDSTNSGSLTLTPWTPGSMLVEAHIANAGDSSSAFALTNVVERPHPVLFFDRRPSWMSTFVRRSLEQDARFAVASRVITSRNISTDAGRPPSALADPALLELYDVIVVGTPARLTTEDIAGLEGFLRRRGGSVVLLYDEPPRPGPHDRLTSAARWTGRALTTAATGRVDADSIALRMTEVALPTRVSGISDPIVTTGSDSTRAIIWSTTVGPGQVIVSGALDAWKYRDSSASGFDQFWRAMIGRAAREASEAIALEVTPNVAQPGERLSVRVSVRDSLTIPTAQIDSTPVQLWPGGHPGEWIGQIRPTEDGQHWVRASANAARAEAPVVVRAGVMRAGRGAWETIELAARASGGTVGSVEEVVAGVKAKVQREQTVEPWRIMRHPLWLVPFVGLLGFEWFVRRRRGLA